MLRELFGVFPLRLKMPSIMEEQTILTEESVTSRRAAEIQRNIRRWRPQYPQQRDFMVDVSIHSEINATGYLQSIQ
jgi:hypothetical protein